MTCRCCDAARADASYGGIHMACRGCLAREVARGIVCFNARFSKPEDPEHEKRRQAYRDQLARAGVTHEEVKAWI